MSVTSPAHETDPRQSAIPDTHGHAKGEHKPYAEERPIPYSARMLFLWFYHACRRGYPRYLMVADHMNSLTFEDPAAVHAVRRAIKHAEAGDFYGAAEIANVEYGHAVVVHEGITRRGMRYSIGAEVDNDPRSRPDAQNIVDAMKPDATIRSVHFLTIPDPQTGAEYQWPFDNPEFVSTYETLGTERVWEIYMEQLLDAIEKLPGNIIGHFYVPAKFGHWPDDEKLDAYENRFIEACAQAGKAIELNTRFFYRYATDEDSRLKFRSANLRLLRKAKAADVGIAVGSDAHSPKDQGQSFDEALSLLDEAEVNELVFPIAGRLRRVALRAGKESADEAIAPAAPTPLAPSVETESPVAAAAEGLEPVAPVDASGRDEAGSEGSAPRPKRAAPKRAAGSSSKRTTPGPLKGEARGDARSTDAAPAPEAGAAESDVRSPEKPEADAASVDLAASEAPHASEPATPVDAVNANADDTADTAAAAADTERTAAAEEPVSAAPPVPEASFSEASVDAPAIVESSAPEPLPAAEPAGDDRRGDVTEDAIAAEPPEASLPDHEAASESHPNATPPTSGLPVSEVIEPEPIATVAPAKAAARSRGSEKPAAKAVPVKPVAKASPAKSPAATAAKTPAKPASVAAKAVAATVKAVSSAVKAVSTTRSAPKPAAAAAKKAPAAKAASAKAAPAKAPVKAASAKPAAKTAPKPAAKAASSKTVLKATATTAKPAAKSAKPAAKAAAKPVAKRPASSKAAAAPARPAAKPKAKSPATSAKKPPAKTRR